MADRANKRATHFSGVLVPPHTLVATTITMDANHSGSTLILGVATTQTVTLPTATGSGAVFRIVVGVTASGDKVIQVGNVTDEFAGIVYQVDTDTADALVAYPCIAADGFDTITLDGTTSGGLIGDVITLTDIAAGVFLVEGHTMGNGTVVSPLSAAV